MTTLEEALDEEARAIVDVLEGPGTESGSKARGSLSKKRGSIDTTKDLSLGVKPSRPLPLQSTERGKQEKTLDELWDALDNDHAEPVPSPRLRAHSPGGTPREYVTRSGDVVDMMNAYRRLSNEAISNDEARLSEVRPEAVRGRLGSITESSLPPGEGRLAKDYDRKAVQSTDVAGGEKLGFRGENTAAEGLIPRGWKGRGRSRKEKSGSQENERKYGESSIGRSWKRIMQPKVKNMPDIEDDEPAEPEESQDEEHEPSLLNVSHRVHPSTNYDQIVGIRIGPGSTDSEELSEIRRAQKLPINMSSIDTTISNRAIRMIVRGKFSQMQQEAEDGLRRLRTYLVATDLSEEAAYALEWTIGTVLRDGDTLLAVYAVDQEVGTGKSPDPYIPLHGPPINDRPLLRETASVVENLTAATESKSTMLSRSSLSSPALNQSQGGLELPTNSNPATSRAEQERLHAVEMISQTCIGYLRKTRLQVRVVVEVIDCKSPKHMITEAIDGLEPTMVILGSRGRSALKGVLLGSFSNYLVTKSSVPVMVARKRLKTLKGKTRSLNVRLANNLTPAKRLIDAKID